MIKTFARKQDFIKCYLDLLEQDEIKNNLMLGLLKQAYVIPDHLVSVIHRGDWLLGMVAGKNMILAANTKAPRLYERLVNHMEKVAYPGIIGPKDYCEAYQKAYQKINQKSMKVVMNQRIYACNQVNHISHDLGVIRYATDNDFDVLSPWVYEFTVMVEGVADKDAINNNLRRKIKEAYLYVLEVDGEIVSMTERVRPLKHSETVSLVYTPVDKRNQGFATRIVEYVTEEIITEGKTATLYTDLSNPTSNKVYQQIGYKPYCDSVVLNK